MPKVSAEQKRRTLEALEIAIKVGTPFQLGTLYGQGLEIARAHELRERGSEHEARKMAAG